jgi:hypothetical protein
MVAGPAWQFDGTPMFAVRRVSVFCLCSLVGRRRAAAARQYSARGARASCSASSDNVGVLGVLGSAAAAGERPTAGGPESARCEDATRKGVVQRVGLAGTLGAPPLAPRTPP